MRYSLDSTLREVYGHPVGHDVLAKVAMQLGISEGWLTGPLLGGLKLGAIRRVMGKKQGEGFTSMLLELLNRETARLGQEEKPPAWWRDAVFYQVYPRSFCQAGPGETGKHNGNLRGILSRLDDLKALGVDAL